MRGLVLFLLILITVLGAAASARASDDTLIGTGVGAAIGGLFGSQIGHGGGQLVATGIGVAAGGLIGNSVGHAIDTEAVAAGGGRSSIYSEPPAIAYGAYTPTYVAPPAPPPTYIDQDMQTYCRPYSQEIRIAGRLQESYGTACLQPDGTWRVMP